MELNTEYVQAQLQRRRDERQLSAVARGTGLHVRTLQRMAKGSSGTVNNTRTVQEFLKRTERDKKLAKEGA